MPVITAVAYTRYSSDKQQESRITVQLAAIRRFCESHNVQLIHEYVDEAQSGTSDHRDHFQKMVSDAKSKEFQYIIVHRMDRWARNVDDARYYKKYFKKYGIRIISAIEEFDDSPEGEFFELISMGMAEMYSKKLSREAKAGVLANARMGKAHGGIPPLGYKVKNKYYVIEEKEAEAVKIIFDMVANGYGYVAIRDYLNSHGYRRPNGNLFKACFTDVLRNREYTGEYVYNKSAYRPRGEPYNSHKKRAENEVIRIPHGMPQIIDFELFNKVQGILDERKLSTNRINTRKSFLLTGLLRCNECNRAYCGGSTGSGEKKIHVYSCTSKGRDCVSRAINSNYLDDYVMSLLLDCLLAPRNFDNLSALLKVCYQNTYDELTAELDSVVKDIRNIEEKIKELDNSTDKENGNTIRKYVNEEIADLVSLKKDRLFDYDLIQEKRSRFPEFEVRTIIKNTRKIREMIENEEIKQRQRGLSKVICQIRMDNDYVRTIIDFQELIGSYLPIYATIMEKRDFIARSENHYRRALTFPTLSVSVGQFQRK